MSIGIIGCVFFAQGFSGQNLNLNHFEEAGSYFGSALSAHRMTQYRTTMKQPDFNIHE